jgi:hypothetical protein
MSLQILNEKEAICAMSMLPEMVYYIHGITYY